MAKYKMNKNVNHNGNFYPKDSELKPDADGFKELIAAGHAVDVESDFAAPAQPKKDPEQMDVEEYLSEKKEKKKK